MNGSSYISRFDRETAPKSHNGTVFAGKVLPGGLKAPFDDSWGYLEGKSKMEEHSHPTDEVYLVIAGRGYCHIGGEKFEVKPGDVVEIPPNAMHTMECGEGGTLLWAALWWNHME